MLAILAFEVTVYRHQEYYRGRNNLTAPVSKTIFHDITRHHLDDGIINCAKYFINYFFYKFGLEVSFLAGVFSIFCDNPNSCFWAVRLLKFHPAPPGHDYRSWGSVGGDATEGLTWPDGKFSHTKCQWHPCNSDLCLSGFLCPADTWMPVTRHFNWFLIN